MARTRPNPATKKPKQLNRKQPKPLHQQRNHGKTSTINSQADENSHRHVLNTIPRAPKFSFTTFFIDWKIIRSKSSFVFPSTLSAASAPSLTANKHFESEHISLSKATLIHNNYLGHSALPLKFKATSTPPHQFGNYNFSACFAPASIKTTLPKQLRNEQSDQ
jgi:hypothetical protein